MSIEHFENMFTPVCDVCGENLKTELEFKNAVTAKKNRGWISRKINGEWHDICGRCRETAARGPDAPGN